MVAYAALALGGSGVARSSRRRIYRIIFGQLQDKQKVGNQRTDELQHHNPTLATRRLFAVLK